MQAGRWVGDLASSSSGPFGPGGLCGLWIVLGARGGGGEGQVEAGMSGLGGGWAPASGSAGPDQERERLLQLDIWVFRATTGLQLAVPRCPLKMAIEGSGSY